MESQACNFLLDCCVLVAKTQCLRLIFASGWKLLYGKPCLWGDM